MNLSMKPFLGVLLFSILAANPAFTEVTPGFPSLDEYIHSYAQEPDEKAQGRILMELLRKVERSELPLNLEESGRLSLFVLDLALSDERKFGCYRCLEFLRKNPHPVVADPLFEHIRRHTQKKDHVLPLGIEILAALHDERALPYLESALRSSKGNTVEMAVRYLEQLGDARAIPALLAFGEDSGFERQYMEYLLEVQRNNMREPDAERAARQARSEAAKLQLRIDRALRNIRLLDTQGILCPFDLEDEFIEAVVKNGFAVHPNQKNEIYEFYNEEYPFITADLIFHTYIILQRAAMDELERFVLGETLLEFSEGLSSASLRQASDPRWKADRDLCLHNAAFFDVAARLLGSAATADGSELPSPWRERVLEEVSRVGSASEITISEILGYVEDYSEYKVRGRHREGFGEGYFQAVSWLGRGNWPASTEQSTRRALLLVALLDADPGLDRQWRELDELLTFLAGESDDLSFDEYRRLAMQATNLKGEDAIAELLDSPSSVEDFTARLAALPSPGINSQYVSSPGREHWQSLHKGFRVLGQRSTEDGRLFQSLMDAGVWPPSGLHVMAQLLGSERAAELSSSPSTGAAKTWEGAPNNLVEGTLWCFEPVFEPDARAAEVFLGRSWEDKQINAALGAWAEARHAAAPYLKSAHIYSGLSGMTDDIHGYVEPYPEFYRRVAQLAGSLNDRLVQLGVYDAIEAELRMLNAEMDEEYGPAEKMGGSGRKIRKHPRDEDWSILNRKELRTERLNAARFGEFIEILDRLSDLASRELAGESQTINDGLFLKGLGNRLRNLSFNISSMNVAEEPMSCVVDVAVDYQSGMCLEAGVGRPLGIYVAIPRGERLFICRGGIYSYYEFTRPIAQRLDDAVWVQATDRLRASGSEPFLLSKVVNPDRPVLSRADLMDLQSESENLQSRFSSKRPWRLVDNWDGPWSIQLAEVRVEDSDLLIKLAESRSVHGNVTLFALDRLTDFVDEPEVFEYFEDRINSFNKRRGRDIQDRELLARVYYAIVAMGVSDLPQAADILKTSGASLERADIPEHWQPMLRSLEGMIEFSDQAP